VKVIVILATLFVAACGTNSPSQPASPNFVVVSTDWRQTVSQPGRPAQRTCPPSRPGDLPALCGFDYGTATIYQYTAHGVFRNQGASGSAPVTFSDELGDSCNTVVNAPAGQVVEASCPLFESPATAPPTPTAKVGQ
jgi:hypothetical protein